VSDEHRDGRIANRAWWDEAAPLHAASALYDLEGFRAGRDDIRPFELTELGPVAGRDLLHLQCHIGTDTISWARHGARVVGLDFSQASLGVARRLAMDCSIDAEFVCADLYDAVKALRGRDFDVYAAPDALLEHTTTHERDHAISEVLSAILDVRLTLELFHEQSFTNVPWPWAVRGEDGFYRVPDDGPRFPLTYSLRARRRQSLANQAAT
jgi:hypothetical protein